MHRDVACHFGAFQFGLSTAPGVFYGQGRPILAWCLRSGLCFHAYFSDWLFCTRLHQGVVDDTPTVVTFLYDLGLGVILPGSRLAPSRHFQFLGTWFDLRRFLVVPSEGRVLALG